MAAKEKQEKVGRKFFRIPLEDPHDASITINGKKFAVINVASHGVGIYLEDADTFDIDTELTDVDLSINGTSCTVKGRIAHVTPASIHYLCGIEIIEMTQQAADILQGFIDQHNASLFSFMP
ncbi:MAG: PilZ domain-containing protein [Proteobacteria bacterium]|nr:PilZ domain-containing protein [Pseudomonadota bacterium]MBU1640387.1 PilZ domain-containing protein [Pseudomonadota bacterium]